MLAIGAAAVSVFIPWDEVLDRGGTIVPALEGNRAEDPALVSGRPHIWLGAWAAFTDNPGLGIGYTNFRRRFVDTYQFSVPSRFVKRLFVSPTSPHSTILGIMAELGLAGILFWLWLQVAAFRNLRLAWAIRDRLGDSTRAVLIQAMFISLIAYQIYSPLSVIQNHKLYWVIIGLTWAIWRLTRQSRELHALKGAEG